MKKTRGEIPIGILYISLHNQLKKKVGLGGRIHRKQLHSFLGRHFLIPKNLRDCSIKELERMKLIIMDKKDMIKVIDCKIDLERDTHKLYKMSGIF